MRLQRHGGTGLAKWGDGTAVVERVDCILAEDAVGVTPTETNHLLSECAVVTGEAPTGQAASAVPSVPDSDTTICSVGWWFR